MKSELIENRIIVWNIEDSKKLFSQGYYGKPIGIPKPKPEEINVPLIHVEPRIIRWGALDARWAMDWSARAHHDIEPDRHPAELCASR